ARTTVAMGLLVAPAPARAAERRGRRPALRPSARGADGVLASHLAPRRAHVGRRGTGTGAATVAGRGAAGRGPGTLPGDHGTGVPMGRRASRGALALGALREQAARERAGARARARARRGALKIAAGRGEPGRAR